MFQFCQIWRIWSIHGSFYFDIVRAKMDIALIMKEIHLFSIGGGYAPGLLLGIACSCIGATVPGGGGGAIYTGVTYTPG